jgi:hypothetical protein
MYKTVIAYSREFANKDAEGCWFSFPCDAHGNLEPLTDIGARCYEDCVSGAMNVVDHGIVKSERRIKVCNCGSDLPSRWLQDARGITVASVCSACEARIKARYRPEIFKDSNYECAEELG